MAAMRPRDKKGCFRRLKEIKRREMSAVNCKRPGIVVEEVEMGTEAHCESQSYLELRGRRIVELDVLAKELECKSCGASLQLLNCFRETVSGLGSFLYITCSNSDCGEINVCHTNKAHRSSDKRRGRPIFDVNTKLAAGRFNFRLATRSIS